MTQGSYGLVGLTWNAAAYHPACFPTGVDPNGEEVGAVFEWDDAACALCCDVCLQPLQECDTDDSPLLFTPVESVERIVADARAAGYEAGMSGAGWWSNMTQEQYNAFMASRGYIQDNDPLAPGYGEPDIDIEDEDIDPVLEGIVHPLDFPDDGMIRFTDMDIFPADIETLIKAGVEILAGYANTGSDNIIELPEGSAQLDQYHFALPGGVMLETTEDDRMFIV